MIATCTQADGGLEQQDKWGDVWEDAPPPASLCLAWPWLQDDTLSACAALARAMAPSGVSSDVMPESRCGEHSSSTAANASTSAALESAFDGCITDLRLRHAYSPRIEGMSLPAILQLSTLRVLAMQEDPANVAKAIMWNNVDEAAKLLEPMAMYSGWWLRLLYALQKADVGSMRVATASSPLSHLRLALGKLARKHGNLRLALSLLTPLQHFRLEHPDRNGLEVHTDSKGLERSSASCTDWPAICARSEAALVRLAAGGHTTALSDLWKCASEALKAISHSDAPIDTHAWAGLGAGGASPPLDGVCTASEEDSLNCAHYKALRRFASALPATATALSTEDAQLILHWAADASFSPWGGVEPGAGDWLGGHGIAVRGNGTLGALERLRGASLRGAVDACPQNPKARLRLALWCERQGEALLRVWDSAMTTDMHARSLIPHDIPHHCEVRALRNSPEEREIITLLNEDERQDLASIVRDAGLWDGRGDEHWMGMLAKAVLAHTREKGIEQEEGEAAGSEGKEGCTTPTGEASLAHRVSQRLRALFPHAAPAALTIAMGRLLSFRSAVVRRLFAPVRAAASGYVAQLSLGPSGTHARMDVPLRLLHLLVRHWHAISRDIEEAMVRTPPRSWRSIVPQVMARLSHPDGRVRKLIVNILLSVGRVWPEDLLYPLLVATCKESDGTSQENQTNETREMPATATPCDRTNHGASTASANLDTAVRPACFSDTPARPAGRSELLAVRATLSALFPLLMSELSTLVAELNRVTLLWEERLAPALQGLQSEAEARFATLRSEAARVEANPQLEEHVKVRVRLACRATVIAIEVVSMH